MSFYGNITNTNSGPFIFDKIYPNRVTLEANKETDGIYAGRFVLVDYNVPLFKTSGSDIKDSYIVYKGSDMEGELCFLYEDENDTESILRIGENIGDINAPVINSFYAVQNGNSYDCYKCVKFDEEGRALFEYSGVASAGQDENSNYVLNASIDSGYIAEEKRIKSYNSSVWQKVYVGQKATYILIADLNAAYPQTAIVEDAPTDSPSGIHFGKESTNDAISIHVQPSWGMRVAMANDGTVSSNDRFSTNEKISKSDVDVIWTQKGENDTYYYNGETHEWDNISSNKVPAAIYFNVAGFDPETGIVDESVDNYITITPTGIGTTTINNDGVEKVVAKGYPVEGTGTLETTPNTQEIAVQLPGIGNAVAKVWDALYGEPGEDGRRSADISWEGAHGETPLRPGDRLIHNREEDGFSFSELETESISGCINSVHDIMGMIIIRVPNLNNIDDWDNKHIYYNENDGKYYRLTIDYNLIELTAEEAINAVDYCGVYTIENNEKVVNGYYIKDNLGNFRLYNGPYDTTEHYYQVAKIEAATNNIDNFTFGYKEIEGVGFDRIIANDLIGEDINGQITYKYLKLVVVPVMRFVEYSDYVNYATRIEYLTIATDNNRTEKYIWKDEDEKVCNYTMAEIEADETIQFSHQYTEEVPEYIYLVDHYKHKVNVGYDFYKTAYRYIEVAGGPIKETEKPGEVPTKPVLKEDGSPELNDDNTPKYESRVGISELPDSELTIDNYSIRKYPQRTINKPEDVESTPVYEEKDVLIKPEDKTEVTGSAENVKDDKTYFHYTVEIKSETIPEGLEEGEEASTTTYKTGTKEVKKAKKVEQVQSIPADADIEKNIIYVYYIPDENGEQTTLDDLVKFISGYGKDINDNSFTYADLPGYLNQVSYNWVQPEAVTGSEALAAAIYKVPSYLYIYEGFNKLWDRKGKLFSLFEKQYLPYLVEEVNKFNRESAEETPPSTEEGSEEISTPTPVEEKTVESYYTDGKLNIEEVIKDIYKVQLATLGKYVPTLVCKELQGFGRDYNTIHGLILRINNKLNDDNINSQDINTVQGAINRLNSLLDVLYNDYGLGNLENLKGAYENLIDRFKEAWDLYSKIGEKDDKYPEKDSLWGRVNYLVEKTQLADDSHRDILERLTKLETIGSADNGSGYVTWAGMVKYHTDNPSGGGDNYYSVSDDHIREVASTVAKETTEIIYFSWNGSKNTEDKKSGTINNKDTIWSLASLGDKKAAAGYEIGWAKKATSTCSYSVVDRKVDFNFSINLKVPANKSLDENEFASNYVGMVRLRGSYADLKSARDANTGTALWRPKFQGPVEASPTDGQYVLNARILTYDDASKNSYYCGPVFVTKGNKWGGSSKETNYTVRIKGSYQIRDDISIEALKKVLTDRGITVHSSLDDKTTK